MRLQEVVRIGKILFKSIKNEIHKKWQCSEKCFIDPTLREHVQSGLKQFSKLCYNQCLLRRLNVTLISKQFQS